MANHQQIIHERNAVGQHRLIVLRNGIPEKSPWIEPHAVGLFRNFYFHVGAAGETVPPVFRVSAIAHEEL